MKKKLLQINNLANSGSTGKIAEGLGKVAMKNGWDSFIAYGRWCNSSESNLIRIGSNFGNSLHGLKARLFDAEGLGSKIATRKLVSTIQKIKPDIIQIQVTHAYYLNYPILFDYLNKTDIPVFWTFHDSWAFTGHCPHFAFVGCEKWKTGCYDCQLKKAYPSSWFLDRSKENYLKKKYYFSSNPKLTIITVSDWIGNMVKQSFLKDKDIITIHNGINIDRFKPSSNTASIMDKYGVRGKKILLAVSSKWGIKKGLNDIIELRKVLDDSFAIIMVGCQKEVIQQLPSGIIGVEHTESVSELCDMYSAADVFINPTHEDSFPTVNLEAIACGTPIVTYDTGGCSESIGYDKRFGIVTRENTPIAMSQAIMEITSKGKKAYADNCRAHAVNNFDEMIQYQKYIDLYDKILSAH
ncbi:glycosyltransferase [Xylanibacter ruminicola]|uniref:Glycosyltransferase involved in cell wall bisynthesis n=1 Tax=Xylanibacter ruminicola TaxID=839 RepID=A0A1M6R7I0_XYLRU|nr:glycosyltransferase [Xylanibacter ruminicola]SHK28288.1 Glycosyltransferase involved in cell wall bisynthesis [Xylanibacter ruminicola]